MDDNKEYIASFEFETITAFTLDEFIEKVKAATDNGAEISNIAAIVVTKTISNWGLIMNQFMLMFENRIQI